MLRFIVIIGMVFSQFASAQPSVSLQGAKTSAWVVRSIYPNEFGVNEPKGLTFSQTANTFFVLDGSAAISLITMSGDGAGIRNLQDVEGDSLNVAFDGRSGSLFALKNGKSELVKIKADGRGLPDNAAQPARFKVGAFGIKDPQGITFDTAGGRMFVLDAGKSQILAVAPDAVLGFDAAEAVRSNKVERISLKNLGAGSLRGLAYNPENGHLYLTDPSARKLFELTQGGEVVATFDLASLGINNPIAMTFAPSVDNTDNPNNYHLFILDDGQNGPAAKSGGQALSVSPQQAILSETQIAEVSLVAPAALPPGTTLLPSTLVTTIDTSAWTHPSPDPSGIDYWPLTGRLVIDDSEVEESVNGNPPAYWHGFNVYLSTLGGSLTGNCTTFTSNPTSLVYNNYTNEPSGISINPNNNHFFISSDGSNSRVHEVGPGADGVYCTPDDTVTRTLVASLYGATDTEDTAYGNNTLYLADGVNAEVYSIPLGPNGILGGGDDGPVTHFDTAAMGFNDLEGIGFNADAGTLFIVSTKGTENYLGEVTTSGTLIRAYNLSFMGTTGNIRSDVAYAPSSQNPAVKSIYIASRGVDNNNNPNENDGKIWEINIGGSGSSTPFPTPTKTNTATPVPSVTPTTQTGGSVCLPAVQDAYIIQDAPTQNHGSENDLKVKPDAGKQRRILIRFDLSTIPQASTVTSSTLRLYEDSKKDNQVITLYRLTNSWVESQVTWNNRGTGSAWTAPGGDFNSAQLATFSPNVDKQYRDINVTGVTQSWVNGSVGNYGLLLLSTGVNGEVKFKSREESNASKNPQLCINYQLTPSATNTPQPTFTPTNTPLPTFTSTPGASPTSTPLPTDTPPATPTSTVLDSIFADGFESGDFSAWTSNASGGGDLSVSSAAALVGGQGMQALINDTTPIYVTDDSPESESQYRARFYFDPNSITMANGDSHVIFFGYSGPSPFTPVLRVMLRFTGGVYQVRAGLWTDSSAWMDTSYFNVTDAPHIIEVDWRAATSVGANNGSLTLWLDGVEQVTLSGVDNDTWRIDRARLGGVSALDAGTSGIYYFDAFESRRQTYIGP